MIPKHTHKYVKTNPSQNSIFPDKHTWNRDNILFNSRCILQKDIINLYKDKSNGNPKLFLKLIYSDKRYIEYMTENGKLIKRGSNSKNWKIHKLWICHSLNYVNSVYQTMGKKVWSDKGNHNKQPIQQNQCEALTKSKKIRCKRSKCKDSNYCTQHTTRYI